MTSSGAVRDNIVALDVSVRKSRPHLEETARQGAKILFFTGVRYQRLGQDAEITMPPPVAPRAGDEIRAEG